MIELTLKGWWFKSERESIVLSRNAQAPREVTSERIDSIDA
jgi:hypothetical protein